MSGVRSLNHHPGSIGSRVIITVGIGGGGVGVEKEEGHHAVDH